MQNTASETDNLQRILARLIATSPAGVNLLLIGGFRYRLLDQSQRFSIDIDYHWAGDLWQKQKQLLDLCQRSLLGEVHRERGYEGSALARSGPDADSPNASFIDLHFWKNDVQIEIPVELTRILCFDPPIVRTAQGTLHATPSDADLIESKIIAVLGRLFLQHRDLLDVFLYSHTLRQDSPARLKQKLAKLSLSPDAVARRLQDLDQNRPYHASAIQKVIDSQMESPVARQLSSAGGGKAVFDSVLPVILHACSP